MQITAKSQYDKKAITALVRASVYKKHNPKKQMIWFFALVGLVIVASICLLCIDDSKLIPILLLCLSGVLILMQCYTYLLLPVIQYRSLNKFAEVSHTFNFTDDSFTITSSGAEFNGSSSIAYPMLYQVMETSEYLFLYQTNQQAFIVDKSTVKGGSISELSAKFADMPNLRYIRCNY